MPTVYRPCPPLALQAGTSHNLGDNFARAFGTRYLDEAGQLQVVALPGFACLVPLWLGRLAGF